MADIIAELKNIAEAEDGEDVRWSIHDGIKKINEGTEEDNRNNKEEVMTLAEEKINEIRALAEEKINEIRALAEEKITSATNIKNEASVSEVAAAMSAAQAAQAAQEIQNLSKASESYAVGTNNEYRDDDSIDNSKFYKEEAQKILNKVKLLLESISSGALIPAGTVSFEDLPEFPKIGYMYNISNDFVTDHRFIDGENKYYKAGTNVYWTAENKWDILVGAGVTGVKGNVESTYRLGDVNLTPENLGLGKVENKSASEILQELKESNITAALGMSVSDMLGKPIYITKIWNNGDLSKNTVSNMIFEFNKIHMNTILLKRFVIYYIAVTGIRDLEGFAVRVGDTQITRYFCFNGAGTVFLVSINDTYIQSSYAFSLSGSE